MLACLFLLLGMVVIMDLGLNWDWDWSLAGSTNFLGGFFAKTSFTGCA